MPVYARIRSYMPVYARIYSISVCIYGYIRAYTSISLCVYTGIYGHIGAYLCVCIYGYDSFQFY